jgi:UDP-2-acetamido-3-amino-2,3-dideoxy-glucuronate N-acetyltransferase
MPGYPGEFVNDTVKAKPRPSDKLAGLPHIPRVAVVGCGYWGKNLVRNFAELGALAGICDPDRATAERLAGASASRVLEWSALLDDDAVEAVAIAAPAALHFRLAGAALEAGKHVFVEKPLALEVAEAERLCETAARVGRKLMVGHLLQYHPAFLKLKELVSQGALGRLQYIYSNRLNLGKIRREEDILWSFAPHDISMILSLVGQEPERVAAEGGAYLHKTIADVTTTHLSFAGGERAHIFVSWLHPFKEQKLVVIGDRAQAVFNDGEPWDRKLQLFPHRIEWRDTLPVPEKAEAQPVALDAGEPLQLECAHFLESVAKGTTPRTDGQEGVRVLKVLARASAALKGGASAAKPEPATASYPGVMIHETAYVDQPAEIGAGSKIWHFSHVLPRTKIGRDVIVGQNVVIGPDVTVGDRCKIQNNVSLYKGVTLEEGVFCGPSCVFTNVMNPRAEIERKSEFRPTLVRKGATIGANATIVCGTTLGEYCFIGAGAVVTRDVPAYALMVGSPARRIGWMSKAGERLGPDLVCPRTTQRYKETGPDKLEEIKNA